jgi:hypothetical protein
MKCFLFGLFQQSSKKLVSECQLETYAECPHILEDAQEILDICYKKGWSMHNGVSYRILDICYKKGWGMHNVVSYSLSLSHNNRQI